MNLISPWRDDQSQRFITIFKIFKNQSQRFMTLEIFKNQSQRFMTIFRNFKNQSQRFMTIFRNFKKQSQRFMTTFRNFKNQSQRFMTIFRNFKKQSQRFMTTFRNFINHGADLSTLTVSPCVTRFHSLSHGFTVASSFLTVFQILSGFFSKLTVF